MDSLSYVDEAALAVAAFLALSALVLHMARDLDSWAKWLLLGLLPFRFAWAIFFFLVAPNWVTSTDSVRYLGEIEQISRGPLLWNPFLGKGPEYRASAKLGMSWLYGSLAHVFDVDPAFLSLLAGVVLSCLTFLLAFELARQVSSVPFVWVGSACLVAVHPQSLYWSGKIVRENLTIFLVAAVFLVGLRLMDRWKVRSLLLLLVLTLALSATRAQLALFGPMVLVAVAWVHFRERAWITAISAVSVISVLPLIEGQIRRAGAGPREILAYLSPSPEFLSQAVARVIASPELVQVKPHAVGAFAWLLLPYSLLGWVGLGVAIWSFRSVFPLARSQAATLMVCSLIYLAVLAAQDLTNFRAQATVLPLLAPVIVAAAWYAGGFARLANGRREGSAP
jgi:hypothetical protein